MAAIQPWSAAGAEKPMTTLSPASSFDPLSALLVPPLSEPESSRALLVHAARDSAVSPATKPRARRWGARSERVDSDFIVVLLAGCDGEVAFRTDARDAASGDVSTSRQPLLEEHGDDDDQPLDDGLG